MARTTARLPRLTSALVGVVVLAGCSGVGPGAGHNGPMMDSGPGPMMSTGDTSTGSSSSTPGTVDDADVAFVRAMITHHHQAIRMARSARDRATDPRVVDLAARIEQVQAAEITTMTGWLREWGPGGGQMGSGMAGMGGMVSAGDVHALMTATGADVDRLFLTGMIEHHRGAIAMAEEELAGGRDAEVLALARSIRESQSAEITEMERLLSDLGG